jgi:ribonuclease BN (tRNA processing enzyme)
MPFRFKRSGSTFSAYSGAAVIFATCRALSHTKPSLGADIIARDRTQKAMREGVGRGLECTLLWYSDNAAVCGRRVHIRDETAMRLKVIGCSGGIGANLRTTALLLDHDVLIDAGTGVGDLELEQLVRIDHIFVTHSHLDHVASIPFLVDTVGAMRSEPLTVHALPETIADLKQHLFNWKLWPDFTQIPSPEHPLLRFSPVAVGCGVTIANRTITPVPANHVVPAVGYAVNSGHGSLVFTGDTSSSNELWRTVNNIGNLRYVIIETAFSNGERELAMRAKHLCPSLLGEQLALLTRPAEVFITHLKPGEGDKIMQEIAQGKPRWNPKMLQHHQVFEF